MLITIAGLDEKRDSLSPPVLSGKHSHTIFPLDYHLFEV